PIQTNMSTETPATANPLPELVNAITAAFQTTPAPPSASGSPMAMPATFAGEAAECSGFLLQINLFIQMQPQQFPSENAKVAFLISLLTGKALQWAKAIWNSDNPIIHSYEQFTSHFSEVFSTTTGQLSTSDLLFRLQQGNSTINEYTLHFRTLAVASGWNETVLLGAHRQGLNPQISAAMSLYDDSIGLEAFLQRTTRVSQRLAACQLSTTAPQPTSVFACTPVPEPMQVDSSRLTRSERNRRIMNGLCLYCGQSGHLLRTCAIRPPRPVVSTLSTEVETASLTLVPITLHTPKTSLNISFNVVCINILYQSRRYRENHWGVGRSSIHHLPSHCRVPPSASSWDARGFKYIILNSAGIPAISSAGVNTVVAPVVLASTQIESPDPVSIPEIPAEYMAFQDVFSKQAATFLPPHRPWDCAIDLLPGAQLPKGRVYPLSIPERQAMEEYIKEALQQGFIQPSTSPAASSFFFVGKKDGGLRPCIDYRQLNSQILQQPYPLPLVPATLEELRGAQVFTKLDLRSAYNLVRVRAGDEWKTAFVTPTGLYEYRVMPYGLSISPSVFQTFMNEVFQEFLHRFVVVYIDDILICSQNMAEHRQHIQQVLHKLREHSLYLKLEKCEFHRPSVQFLGYVISAEGVQMDQGKVQAILDWPQPTTIKELQRFLGFSNFYRRFIQNYSSITAPLTSLLRGKPKNINWNPSAHGAFNQLKKIFSTAPLLHHPDPKKPFNVEVDASTTGVGAVLSQAVGESPLLHPCAYYSRKLSPAEQNYDVGNRELLAIKLALEEWRHWLEGATHPFTIITDHKNLQYLREARRLNPRQASMRRDTIRYVQSCSVCAMSTSPRQLPSGKLVPLPIPQRPWSHLGVDFVPPRSNTCILVAVERFSKMCKFVPLRGLPTAMETAELLFQHLFRHFGLPEEIVSDQGPQFISHVWKAFFKLLGVSVHLSSGYHPQTSGQTERKIQELGRYLRAYCYEEQHSWNRFLLWAEYAQNSLRQDTTGMTPFQCVLGYQPPLFPWTEEPSNVPAVDYWFRESERVWDSAHHHLERAVRHHKRFADRRRRPAPNYQPGEQ
ncbi:hypothetical protein M9458_013589, partial [Cirrhinus mrigala]